MANDIDGPFKTASNRFGRDVPFYVLTFNKRGKCKSPKSRDHLFAFLQANRASDVILYSHGWNNDFPTALKRYEKFLKGVSDSHAAHPGRLPANFKPVFVGIIWPSTILTWPSENPPDIAADIDLTEGEFAELLTEVKGDDQNAVVTLLKNKSSIDLAELEKLAALIAPHLEAPDTTEDEDGAYTPEDLVGLWRDTADLQPETGQDDQDDGGFDDFGGGDDDDQSDPADNPVPAGLLSKFDPRVILRLTTVLMMKDRAGRVGARGVSKIVSGILGRSRVRLHLVGHSYGTKVVATALVKSTSARKAETMLLLQPAINHLAFAPDIGNGKSGGFRPVFGKLKQPVTITFTRNDFPLYRVFHFAARRKSDIGELKFAARLTKYAALGGYGPRECSPGECKNISLPRPGQSYPRLPNAVRLLSLNGKNGIKGHSDVNTPYTYWAMINQMA